MKNRIYIQKVLILIAVIAVVLNSFSSGFSEKANVKSVKKTETAGKHDEKQVTLKAYVFEAIVPFVQSTVSHQFYFIFEFSYTVYTRPVIEETFPLFTCQLYKTLFRLIISPNAP